MKAKIAIVLILTLFCSNLTIPVFSETNDKYIEKSEPIKVSNNEEDMFAPIDLDLTDYTHMNKQNKRFKLFAEKEGKPSYVKTEGQIWDEDMLFRYNYYSNEANLRVLPSYGSLGSYVTRQLDENTSIMVGQDSLIKVNGDLVNFSLDNYSYYSSGARLSSSGKHINYSVGAFTETDTQNQQLAAVITSKPTTIKKLKGEVYFGGGIYSNLLKDMNFNTAGVFAQYKNPKLSVSTQISNSSYTKAGYSGYNKAHLLTQYKVNEHLTLKNKLVHNFDVEEVQGEIGIVLNPMKEIDRLEFEVAAANYQSQNVVTRQRLKFVTSFKF